ncbi:MAG: formyltransferase family protein [Patescibacteria group bacterium]
MTIAIAGSTHHTVMCAEKILEDSRFEISWILTPAPRHVGRKQELVQNPLHLFAVQHEIPFILIDKKIDETVRVEITEASTATVDFLLVLDFGYIVPNWLLELPMTAPINIHPSDLPKYRGSSPGQFVLLYGEQNSAISVIVMNDLLDQGDLIYQFKFDVLSTWMMTEYYHFAFTKISEQLPNVLTDFYAKKITAEPQPLETPTPIARRLTRKDGYVSWGLLSSLSDRKNEHISSSTPLPESPLLTEVNQTIKDWPTTISNAIRALSPWPGVWTIVHTPKGDKRMKILSAKIENGKLELEHVQIEGELPCPFEEIQLS